MAKRIIIYGPSKIGISRFLAENKSAIFIDTFNSLGHLNVKTSKDGSSFESVCESIDTLILSNTNTPEKYRYDTIVIDHLMGLERLIYKHVCEANNIVDIEYLKYGKGHHLAFIELQRFLEKLDCLANHAVKPVNIIIAAHSTIENYTTLYQENTARSVLATTIKPPKENVSEYLKIWSDGLFYADNYRTITGGYFSSTEIDLGPSATSIFTTAMPNFDAGTRFAMEGPIPMIWECFSGALNWVEKIPESVYASTAEKEEENGNTR